MSSLLKLHFVSMLFQQCYYRPLWRVVSTATHFQLHFGCLAPWTPFYQCSALSQLVLELVVSNSARRSTAWCLWCCHLRLREIWQCHPFHRNGYYCLTTVTKGHNWLDDHLPVARRMAILQLLFASAARQPSAPWCVVLIDRCYLKFAEDYPEVGQE